MQQNKAGLSPEAFRGVIDGKTVQLYTLTNKAGAEAHFINQGAKLVSLVVPSRSGYTDVILGHDSLDEYIHSEEAYFGAICGRYANRIARGHFTIDGVSYELPINNGPNSLHGGKKGFNAKVWDALQMNDTTLVLNYISAYGEEGFSGELKTTVIYTFTDDNELVIEYMAKTNKKTVINLTSHGFFSLAGIANPTPSIENLECEINADFYIPIDEVSIPTGEIRFVKGTPFDFRTPKTIGQDINADHEQIKNGAGYDHCFVLNKREEGELSFAARIMEPVTGRTMEVYTTEPGVQLYTDNWADGYKGQHGATFPRRSGICFEAQHFPDSPNRPYFPSVVLNPGEQYKQKTIYKFGTIA